MPAEVTIISNHAAAIIAAVERAVREGNLKTAELGAHVTQDEIQNGPKSGHTYHGHRASAPGEAPAILSGALFAGIVFGPAPEDGPTAAKWESTDEKSDFLEHGTPSGRILPRPFMAPAAAEVEPEHARLVAQEIQKVLG